MKRVLATLALLAGLCLAAPAAASVVLRASVDGLAEKADRAVEGVVPVRGVEFAVVAADQEHGQPDHVPRDEVAGHGELGSVGGEVEAHAVPRVELALEALGTDMALADSDGDGLSDYEEVECVSDPSATTAGGQPTV